MTTNIVIQYTVVIVLILGALVWIIRNVIRKNKTKGGSCCGCSLADKCQDYHRQEKNNTTKETPPTNYSTKSNTQPPKDCCR